MKWKLDHLYLIWVHEMSKTHNYEEYHFDLVHVYDILNTHKYEEHHFYSIHVYDISNTCNHEEWQKAFGKHVNIWHIPASFL